MSPKPNVTIVLAAAYRLQHRVAVEQPSSWTGRHMVYSSSVD